MTEIFPKLSYALVALVCFVAGGSLTLWLAGYRVKEIKLSFISWSHPDTGTATAAMPGATRLSSMPVLLLALLAGVLLGGVALMLLGYVQPDRSAEITTLTDQLTAANTTISNQSAEIKALKEKHPDPPEGSSALHDHGIKWRIAYNLSQFKGTCKAVIVHYPDPYSQNLAEDMKAILDVARWESRTTLAKTTLPKGFTMKAATGVPNECAMWLRHVVSGTVHVSMIQRVTDALPSEHLDGCAECFEIDFGNDPNS